MHNSDLYIDNYSPEMLMPWSTDQRKRLREFTGAEIRTYKSLDLRIVAACRPELRVDHVSTTFANYADTRVHMDEKEVINTVLPVINSLINDAPRVMKDVAVAPLPSDRTESYSYTRLQVATCIAHMFLNAYDYDYMEKCPSADINDYPTPTLTGIFKGGNAFALACILAYFDYVGKHKDDPLWCRQRIVYRRFVMQRNEWVARATDATVGTVMIGGDDFDDAQSNLHIVAANPVIGGNLFEKSCTQEEAVMLSRPEMLMMLLVCPNPATDGHAINVCIGAEKISAYGGHGSSLHYMGPADEGLTVASTAAGYRIAQISHAFVVPAQARSVDAQYIRAFGEDIYRLTVGFSSVPLPRPSDSVAIGNFAYEFTTCPHGLRVIQSIMAAAVARQNVAYCSGDKALCEDIQAFIDWADKRKVTDVMAIYMREINNEWKRDGAELTTNVLNMIITV